MGRFDEKIDQIMTIVNERIKKLEITNISVSFEKDEIEYTFIIYRGKDELGGYAIQSSFFEREDVSAEELADGVMYTLEMVR